MKWIGILLVAGLLGSCRSNSDSSNSEIKKDTAIAGVPPKTSSLSLFAESKQFATMIAAANISDRANLFILVLTPNNHDFMLVSESARISFSLAGGSKLNFEGSWIKKETDITNDRITFGMYLPLSPNERTILLTDRVTNVRVVFERDDFTGDLAMTAPVKKPLQTILHKLLVDVK